MSRLIKIDEHSRPDHFFLTEEDECYHVLEYTPHQGANHSATNNLILNLKKSVDRKGKGEYYYKEQAIIQAGDLLRGVLDTDWLSKTPTLVPIPCSKAKDHKLYDDRMLQVIRRMARGLNADIRELLVQTTSLDSFHEGYRLRPEELCNHYEVDESQSGRDPRVVVLFDDMLTTGSHFKAAKSTIANRWPGVLIAGIFIARVVRPEADNDLSIFNL